MGLQLDMTLARLAELEAEQEAIEERLSARAAEWYRKESGRTHFHTLELVSVTHEGELWFFTDTRAGGETVRVPRSWFEGVDW